MRTMWDLLASFFQIGLFSIGGGYAVIPLIQQKVVEQAGWLTGREFADVVTISQMTPGPLAVNASTFVGMRLGGIAGAVGATLGCVAGGVVLSLALYRFVMSHRDCAVVDNVLSGLKAASIGLIASAGLFILRLALSGGAMKFSLPLFILCLFMLRRFKTNPMAILAVTGIAGAFFFG